MLEELERELFSKYDDGLDNIADIYILSKQFDKAKKICSVNKLGKLYEAMNEMNKAEEVYEKHANKMSLAEFYERRYEQTNDERYIDKAEQAWKEIDFNQIYHLAKFYERRYEQTNDEKG
ncbi:MAG: hypothetical protein O7C56_00540 [Rickettsia endosymbiont of Ixodes persulcatus]|nr:hypothetical protein [Rickettsia endosymbiont of Ixodes persulcatus]